MLQERAKLLSKRAVPLCIPTTTYDKSIFFAYLPEHDIAGHFHLAIPGICGGILLCLNLHFSID